MLADPPSPRGFSAAGWIIAGALATAIIVCGILLGVAWMQL